MWLTYVVEKITKVGVHHRSTNSKLFIDMSTKIFWMKVYRLAVEVLSLVYPMNIYLRYLSNPGGQKDVREEVRVT